MVEEEAMYLRLVTQWCSLPRTMYRVVGQRCSILCYSSMDMLRRESVVVADVMARY